MDVTPRAFRDVLARAGEIIGALAIDLDRRIGGRRLFDRAGEGWEDGGDVGQIRANVAGRDYRAFKIKRIGLRAEFIVKS